MTTIQDPLEFAANCINYLNTSPVLGQSIIINIKILLTLKKNSKLIWHERHKIIELNYFPILKNDERFNDVKLIDKTTTRSIDWWKIMNHGRTNNT